MHRSYLGTDQYIDWITKTKFFTHKVTGGSLTTLVTSDGLVLEKIDYQHILTCAVFIFCLEIVYTRIYKMFSLLEMLVLLGRQ